MEREQDRAGGEGAGMKAPLLHYYSGKWAAPCGSSAVSSVAPHYWARTRSEVTCPACLKWLEENQP